MDSALQIIDLSSDLYIDTESTLQNPVIGSHSINMLLALNRTSFVDEKEATKFIKNVERIVRTSLEYREFVHYIRCILGYSKCLFTNETYDETNDVEIHHHPLTLFDIAEAITSTYIHNKQRFNSFNIASEIIKLHFSLSIGFIPLISTLHKKFHSGNLDIPIDIVIGDWKYIVNNYVLSDATRQKIKEYCSISKETVRSRLLKEEKDVFYPAILRVEDVLMQ